MRVGFQKGGWLEQHFQCNLHSVRGGYLLWRKTCIEMNSNWVGCLSVVVHSSLRTMKNGTNLCWVVSGCKGERSLKAGTEVIDHWEENRREFLARFL